LRWKINKQHGLSWHPPNGQRPLEIEWQKSIRSPTSWRRWHRLQITSRLEAFESYSRQTSCSM
jgi:hypothetical protein